MEKLNNESDVSRETSKKEIKIIFKNENFEIISIHRREIDGDALAFTESIKYIIDLLRIYDANKIAIMYVNDVLFAMVEKISAKCYKVVK